MRLILFGSGKFLSVNMLCKISKYHKMYLGKVHLEVGFKGAQRDGTVYMLGKAVSCIGSSQGKKVQSRKRTGDARQPQKTKKNTKTEQHLSKL